MCPFTVMSIDRVMTQHLSDATSQIDGLTFISLLGPAYTPATTCRPCYKPDEGQKTEAQRAASLTLNLFMSQDYVYKANIR